MIHIITITVKLKIIRLADLSAHEYESDKNQVSKTKDTSDIN